MIHSGSTSTPGVGSFSGWRTSIGEMRGAGQPGQLDDARPRRLAEQQHDRDGGAEQHAVDGARAEHAEHRRDGDDELGSTEAPDVLQRADLDQARHRREHDRRQHRLRQVAQQPRREQHDEQGEDGRDQSGERRSRAGALVDQRLRHAAAHRKAATESRRADCRRQPPAAPGWRRTDCRASGRTSGRSRTSRRRARTKPASAIGSSSFRSCRLTAGSPRDGQALRHLAEQAPRPAHRGP